MNSTFRVLMNAALLSALAAIVTSSWLLRSNTANTNYEFLPDMAHSARYSAYSQNPNFSDGKTLQQPPQGTIAREHLPLHYTAAQPDALRAGNELVNPLGSGNENSIQRGSNVYGNFCAVCHGADATGMGPVAQRGFPPPPSLLLPHALQMKDGQMFHVLTYGQNNMPSYAGQLSTEDRWNVITYVRSVQAAGAKTASTAQSGISQNATAPAGGK
ncbi:MAG TPA: cytochrome c [Clostridia bacterium]|nr:cytochrome c [Clostridia bacterium]